MSHKSSWSLPHLPKGKVLRIHSKFRKQLRCELSRLPHPGLGNCKRFRAPGRQKSHVFAMDFACCKAFIKCQKRLGHHPYLHTRTVSYCLNTVKCSIWKSIASCFRDLHRACASFRRILPQYSQSSHSSVATPTRRTTLDGEPCYSIWLRSN